MRRWWQKKSHSAPPDDPRRTARRVLRRSTNVARRGGLITGSSFYVGMVPAMAMIYCEQLVTSFASRLSSDATRRIPCAPPEILVIQGRYATLEEAAAALARAGADRGVRSTGADTAVRAIQQLPAMIGLRVRRVNWRSPIDVVVFGAEIASYLVPVISLPVWAYASARAMRRIGRSAIDFYGGDPPEPLIARFTLLARPPPRTRRLVIASVVPLALALGVLFSLFPSGLVHPAVRWIGLVLGELALLLTFARLIRLTRIAT